MPPSALLDGSLDLVAGSTTVRVFCSTAGVLASVGAMFPPYVRTTDQTTSEDVVHVRIHGSDAGYRIGDEPQHLGMSELVEVLEHRVASLLLSGYAEHVHLHASAFVLGAGAWLLPGPSGCGKSTAALEACAAGNPILGDDVILVDAQGRLSGFRRWPKVSVERVRALGIPPEDTVLWEADAEECWVHPASRPDWGGWGGRADCIGVAVARYRPDRPPKCTRLRPEETLAELMGATLASGRCGGEALDRLALLAETAVGLRIVHHGGDTLWDALKRSGDAAPAMRAPTDPTR